MKAWIITANTWTSGWGAQIDCFGVYTDKGQAVTQMTKLPSEYTYQIDEVELDTETDIYLGGYVE